MSLLITVTCGEQRLKCATSCGKAFVTNILLASTGEAKPPQSGATLLPSGVSTFSLIPLELPHFTTIN